MDIVIHILLFFWKKVISIWKKMYTVMQILLDFGKSHLNVQYV